VAKKELDLILETERAADAEIENARVKARKMLDDAAKTAEQISVDSARQAEARAAETVETARRSADLAYEDAMNEAMSEIDNIKSLSSKNFDKAVQLVVDRIMKAV